MMDDFDINERDGWNVFVKELRSLKCFVTHFEIQFNGMEMGNGTGIER